MLKAYSFPRFYRAVLSFAHRLGGKRVLFSGAGLHAAAKIRLLLKTEARIEFYGDPACDNVLDWAQNGQLVHFSRCLTAGICEAAGLAEGSNSRPRYVRSGKGFCRLIVACRAFPI